MFIEIQHTQGPDGNPRAIKTQVEGFSCLTNKFSKIIFIYKRIGPKNLRPESRHPP